MAEAELKVRVLTAVTTGRHADRYKAAIQCKECGHFMRAADQKGHDRYHEEPRR